jgi:DNA helicase HerA-like ATPase
MTETLPNGTRDVETTDQQVRVWKHDLYQPLLDVATGEIGRVVSSEKEPAGAHQFFFWAADDALTLDVGHIVVAFSEEAAVIGVVDEPRRYSDLRTFLDDYFDRHVEIALDVDTPTQRPEILVYTVKVLASQHRRPDVQSQRPVITGPVYFATQAAIEYALGTQEFTGAKVPALMHTNGNYVRDVNGDIATDERGLPKFQRTPLYLDEDYLVGPEAGHANWTGQSGLATKTSHALFLISSVFQTLQREQQSVAAIMFNVKGPDLLWLDKPAQPDESLATAYASGAPEWKGLGSSHLEAYEAFGLRPEPFDTMRLFAPFRPGHDPKSFSGAVQLAGFNDYRSLNTARQAAGETDKVFPILWSLRTALRFPSKLFDFNDLDDKLWGFIYELSAQQVTSLDGLRKTFEEIDEHFAFNDKEDNWRGHHKATIRKAQNRFRGLKDKLGGLLADGDVNYGSMPQVDAPFVSNELRVVDISSTNSISKELIVSSTINAIWRMAEEGTMGVDKLIIFVDELNKYAPAGGEGGLRETLVDIAARGRHLNVVLLGAQQFRSKVDGEILGNCGTSFYGRIGDEEIINAAYRSISETAKQELLGLPKGRLLVRHAHYRSPLFGTFPMPPTIPGAVGQRIFSGAVTTIDPSDALFRTLKKLMGGKAPTLADVKVEAQGASRESIEKVRQNIDRLYGGKPLSIGADPWKKAKSELRTAVSMASMT